MAAAALDITSAFQHERRGTVAEENSPSTPVPFVKQQKLSHMLLLPLLPTDFPLYFIAWNWVGGHLELQGRPGRKNLAKVHRTIDQGGKMDPLAWLSAVWNGIGILMARKRGGPVKTPGTGAMWP